MRRLFKLLIPMSIIAMSGCVVAPYGYHRGLLRSACRGRRPGSRRGRPAVTLMRAVMNATKRSGRVR